MTDLDGTVTQHDGNVLAVDGKSNFDAIFTTVTHHDGKVLAVHGFSFLDGNFLAVDGKSNFDGIFTVVTQHVGKLPAADVFVFLAPQVSGLMPNTYLVHEHKLKRGSPRPEHSSCSPERRQQLILFLYWLINYLHLVVIQKKTEITKNVYTRSSNNRFRVQLKSSTRTPPGRPLIGRTTVVPGSGNEQSGCTRCAELMFRSTRYWLPLYPELVR